MQFGPRTLIFFILLLAMPAVSYWRMFKPLNEQKAAAIEDIKDKRKQLDDLAKATSGDKNVAAQIDELRKAVAFIENKLPKEMEMDKVLLKTTQLAEKDGLTTKSVRLLKIIDGPGYSEQPIKMVITGPMAKGFYPFICDLEGLNRLTKIGEMTITADEKNPGVVSVEMTLTIYFEPGNAKVAVAQ
ncbi:MAG TPA: type 4a pilus biogenesis protein PilO [Phycisphaerae bacterium]|nr:type 4a pilus biogenesis protein PilO [Phycisphaerae bacterium]